MAWTDEMVEELKRLWAEGVTTGEIGRRLNISKNSIVGKVHRLGLSGRPSPIKKKSESDTKEKVSKPAKPTKEKKVAPKVIKEAKSEPKQAPVKEIPVVADKEPKTKPAEVKKPLPQETKTLTPTVSEEDDIKLAKTLNMATQTTSKTGNLSLVELDNHTCRWPVGDPKDENFHFCGKKIRLGQTYCEEHAAIAYVKPSKK